MGTFGDFVIARTGMMSSQMALNITGQNISNINTTGYTRRSLDQSTFVVNGSGLYRSVSTVYAGAGVMMNGISQLRDPYLDIRFRNEMSNVGSADSLLAGMEQIQQVINDVNKNGITTQFQDLLDKFGKLNANNIGTAEFDNLIKNSAESLCQLLNQAASKLEDVKKDYQMKYEEEIKNVDTLVQNIRKINEQIRKADINGDQALELRDQRNLLLDELSQYMKVDITYGKEDLGAGVEIEKLTIKIVDESTGKSDYTLVDGINSATISMNEDFSLNVSSLKDRNGNVIKKEIEDPDNPGNTITVDAVPNGNIAGHTADDDPDTDTVNEKYIIGYGALESMRQILTGKGEFAITEEQLQEIQKTYETKYQGEVDAVNALMKDIADLNKQIYDADKAGTSADDLREQRDDMIYKLSKYMDVNVSYQDTTDKTPTGEVIQKLVIKSNSNPQRVLVNGDKSSKVSIDANDNSLIIGNNKVDGVTGSLEEIREILVDGNSFVNAVDEEARGIPYYEKSLDALAKAFAEAMNKINTEDAQGNPLDDITGSGNLFETSDGTDEITADNISISDEWRNGTVEIVTSTDPKSGTTANDNISRFQDLFNKNFTFEAEINGLPNGTVIYKGNFEGFYANMQGVLGMDMQSVSARYDTYATSADELNNSRDAVSGVDLNEEGVNMIQYQKAFAASCRMITALDELMEQVINRMGV